MTISLQSRSTAENPWKKAKLSIRGKWVDWGSPIVLLRGQANEVKVQAPPELAVQLSLGLVDGRGLNITAFPDFLDWVDPVNGTFIWTLTPDDGESGGITLVFFSREEQWPWELFCQVLSANLADEMTLKIDGAHVQPPVVFKVGMARELSLVPTGTMEGVPIALNFKSGNGVEAKDFTVLPVGWGVGKCDEYTWTVTANKQANATFNVELKAEDIPGPISPEPFKQEPGSLDQRIDVSFNGAPFGPWNDRVGYPVRNEGVVLKIRARSEEALGEVFSWGLLTPEGDPGLVQPTPHFGIKKVLTEEGLDFTSTRIDGPDCRFSIVIAGSDQELKMKMESAYHSKIVYLGEILKETFLGTVTLRVRSWASIGLWAQGVRIGWKNKGAFVGIDHTDNLGWSKFKFKAGEITGVVTAETYRFGKPVSIREIDVDALDFTAPEDE